MTHLTGSFVGVGTFPQVVVAAALSIRRVRVYFSRSMLNEGALTATTNYVLTPQGLSVARTVSLVEVETPTTVILTLDGDLSNGTPAYILTVSNVRDLAGNTIDPLANTANINSAFAATGTLTGCYETSTGILMTDLELHIMEPSWTSDSTAPNIASFRKAITTSANKQVTPRARAHSTVDFAFMTDLGALLNGLTDDLDHRDKTTKLCTQTPVFVLDRILRPVYPFMDLACKELALLGVSEKTQQLILSYSLSASPSHRVCSVAVLVVLAAVKTT